MKRLAILLILLLAACAPTTKSDAKEVTGTEGLTITIGTLPSQVFEGQQGLQIPVTLENAGKSDIKDAALTLSGYDRSIFTFEQEPRIEGIVLAGRTLFLPRGERTTNLFSVDKISLQGEKEGPQVMVATACYPYETDASAVVCINPQSVLGEQVVKASCDFTLGRLTATQGAPVAVTRVETAYISNTEVEFRINVDDVSKKGTLVKQSSYRKGCVRGEPITTADSNIIIIDAYLSAQKLNCYAAVGDNPANEFTLREGGPDVICQATMEPDEPGFSTPLNIKLSYGHIISKTFTLNLKSRTLRS